MQANQQGTFYKSLAITRNNESHSNTILRTEFLKKAENYTCVVRDFVCNVTPPLNNAREMAFEIKVKGGEFQPFAAAVFPAWWRAKDYQFTPVPYHSTIEFLRQAQHFLHKFSFLVREIGASGIGGRLDTAAKRAHGYPFLKHATIYDTGTTAMEERGWLAHEAAVVEARGEIERRMVYCKMKSDGVFQFVCSPDFSNNFYISVGAETQQLLGLDGILHAHGEDMLGFGFFLAVPEVTVPTYFESRNALNALDERISLDVVATLPISNKKFAFDGKESGEFILARYPLNDYNKFETSLESTAERATMNVIVREQVNVGLEDLTRKSPASSAIFMLPGTIQEINFQLWTRYFSSGEIIHRRTKMNEGFWSMTLLFGKKV